MEFQEHGLFGKISRRRLITYTADIKKRFVSDDFNNTQTAHHIVALQLTWGF
jgi:hypothetical protein